MPKGSLVYPDGEKYFGELKDQVPHGEGTMTFPDGSKYVGSFLDGQFDGYGTFTTFSGTYIGEWQSGVPDGQGTFTYSDGTTQSGEWENGHFKENHAPDASNKQLSMLDGEEEEGASLQENLSLGQDISPYIIHEENNVSASESAKTDAWSYVPNSIRVEEKPGARLNKVHATVRLREGLYTGELNKGIPHGKGSLTNADGTKYTGTWEQGTMEGAFTVTGLDGKATKCFFKQGVLQKPKKQVIVSFKLMPGRDDDLIEWLETLGEGEKSFHIRQVLREKLFGKKAY